MPHCDYTVPANKEPKQHGWISTVPLSRKGFWLLIYNDELMAKRLVHIPCGTVFTMRSDIYHAGCLGTAGNRPMQIAFLVNHMADYYREFGHISKDICFNNGIYNPTNVNICYALSLVNKETIHDMTSLAQEIEDNYIFCSYMWPSVGKAHGNN